MTKHPNIQVTAEDRERLAQVLRSNPSASDGFRDLAAELRRATVVASSEVPPDVVTMNSTAKLMDLDTGEELVWTLVFPEEADAGMGKVSVLAPMGTAMLGYRVGDVFEWLVPAGKRRLRVDAVLYQPEAVGE